MDTEGATPFKPSLAEDIRPQYLMVRVTPELNARILAAVEKAYGKTRRKRLSKALLVQQMIEHCLKDMGV